LRKIHRSESEDALTDVHDWGIHGDIKPENILWFNDPADEHGILVICDFGFTRFHSRETRSSAAPIGTSPTYRAPEFDLRHRISRAYDIWALACLYLEFITWYMTGPEGVKTTFASKRLQDDRGECIRMDKFFYCIESSNTDNTNMGAMIKPRVLKVSFRRIVSSVRFC
jgi:serine/threonine protein kinase